MASTSSRSSSARSVDSDGSVEVDHRRGAVRYYACSVPERSPITHPFLCDVCMDRFTSASGLSVHKKGRVDKNGHRRGRCKRICLTFEVDYLTCHSWNEDGKLEFTCKWKDSKEPLESLDCDEELEDYIRSVEDERELAKIQKYIAKNGIALTQVAVIDEADEDTEDDN